MNELFPYMTEEEFDEALQDLLERGLVEAKLNLETNMICYTLTEKGVLQTDYLFGKHAN